MARVVVTGATGTIGAAVCGALLARGDHVVAMSRDPERARSSRRAGTDPDARAGIEWHAWADPAAGRPPRGALEDADGVINLLGETVAQHWTAEARQRIRDSRVLSTRMLVAELEDLPEERRPSVLVSQSATGYYGARGDEEISELASAGHDFLAGVVRAWEHEALQAPTPTRVVVTRTGVVLSRTGGALAKMLPFFRAGVGGPVAGGRQYVPWVHLEDVVAALLFCLDNANAHGPVNLTAPNPVSNRELSRALGRVLHRPAVFPVPARALKLLYGEMAEVVTTGQRAVPLRLQQLGFNFRHDAIEPALRDVLTSR